VQQLRAVDRHLVLHVTPEFVEDPLDAVDRILVVRQRCRQASVPLGGPDLVSFSGSTFKGTLTTAASTVPTWTAGALRDQEGPTAMCALRSPLLHRDSITSL